VLTLTADSPPTTPKNLVLSAISELFDQRDPSAIDRYWSAGYVEHSIAGSPGLEGLRELADGLPEGFRHERLRMLSDGGLIVAHGIYHGLGPTAMVAFDLWRVDDGKIAEHWDAHQPWVAKTVSGHTMVDGPTEVTKPEQTALSRSLVQGFVDLIMMGRDRSQIARFFDDDRFIQHNPLIADGVSGLGQAIQTGVWAAIIERAHRILAEGEFVFTQGEGTLHGSPAIFYDLFRVQDGKLAEHWDVVFAGPSALSHGNGLL
jgi:predicted SnoaL-like aldol condensation-catalyzing enzyme